MILSSQATCPNAELHLLILSAIDGACKYRLSSTVGKGFDQNLSWPMYRHCTLTLFRSYAVIVKHLRHLCLLCHDMVPL